MNKTQSVYRTALLLVQHFRDCMTDETKHFHTRVFEFMLHPEESFVAIGRSQEVIDGAPRHKEHAVPLAFIYHESCRLILEGMPDEEIAKLITKHWKIAYISKNQASYLDTKKGLNLRRKMPDGWRLESGDTYERLNLAKIELLPLEDNTKP